MVVDGREEKAVPPYVPYKTFKNFIDGLRVATPSRIDRSVMGSLSGATQSQLLAALKYLGFVTPNGSLTEKLIVLLNASEGQAQAHALQGVLITSYPFLFSRD